MYLKFLINKMVCKKEKDKMNIGKEQIILKTIGKEKRRKGENIKS